MTRRSLLLAMLITAGCALKPPPTPEQIAWGLATDQVTVAGKRACQLLPANVKRASRDILVSVQGLTLVQQAEWLTNTAADVHTLDGWVAGLTWYALHYELDAHGGWDDWQQLAPYALKGCLEAVSG